MNNSTTTNGQPVKQRDLLKHKAYEVLRSRILQNVYPPGTFLAERQLAEELGMSKSPVKAALERLEHEGYISVSPQQGIIIRELSLNEIGDLFEFRAALEGYVLRTLSGKLTSGQQERWEENFNQQLAAQKTPDRMKSTALDTEFHLLPCEFLGNQEILKSMRQLSDKMQLMISRVLSAHPARISTSIEEHREIMDCVCHGRGAEAMQKIEQHLRRGQQLLLAPRDH